MSISDQIKKFRKALFAFEYSESLKRSAYIAKELCEVHRNLAKAATTRADKRQHLSIAEKNLKDYWTYQKEYNKLMNERSA